jgi:hypothetical protein
MLVYLAISSPNILLLIYSVYQITDPIPLSKLTASLPLMIIFSIAASTYLAFLLFSLLVFGKGVLFNIWGHLLLFFEAISGLFIEMSFKCSAATASDNFDLKWCQSDPKPAASNCSVERHNSLLNAKSSDIFLLPIPQPIQPFINVELPLLSNPPLL